MIYARLALGTAFLSAVAGRFGVWDRSVDWGHFERFIHRTAEVNTFMPAFTIPFLAWAATVAEITCGVALIVGFRLRWAALATRPCSPLRHGHDGFAGRQAQLQC